MAGARGAGEARRFASRGGDKLDAALDRLGIEITGKRALDAGASTGGFTDCLLSRGAAEVVAVDVAYGALAWRLRTDDRVRVLERTNVRTLGRAAVGEPVDLVVADLAFISLRTVRDALVGLCRAAGDLVLLVKPQFEASRRSVERGGVVRDPETRLSAVRAVVAAYREAGCTLLGACASPLVGPAGNREIFVHLGAPGVSETDAGDAVLERAVAEAP